MVSRVFDFQQIYGIPRDIRRSAALSRTPSPFQLRPFLLQDAVERRIPLGAIGPDLLAAQNTFELAADLLNGRPAAQIILIGLKLHTTDPQSFKAVGQQQPFAFPVDPRRPIVRMQPGPADLQLPMPRLNVQKAGAADQLSLSGKPDREWILPALLPG